MLIERTIDLAGSPAQVWSLLTDFEQIQRWMPDILSDEPLTPGPIGVGTTTRMTMRERSQRVEYTTELLVFEPHRELVLEMRGGHLGAEPMRVSYRLEDLGGRSRLTYRSQWRPRGFLLWLLMPLIIVIGRSNLRRALKRLADLAAQTPQSPMLKTLAPAIAASHGLE